MSSGNLPPGVSVRDIPGNRPVDERFEKIYRDVEREHPEWCEERVRVEAQNRLEGDHR